MTNALKFLEELYGPTTIGTLIRAYRTRNDLTLDEVAKLLSSTKSYVSDLEHDRKNISLRQTRDIAEKLGESIEVYAKVWIETRLLEADMSGIVEVRPIKESKIVKKYGPSHKKTQLIRPVAGTTKKTAKKKS